MGWVALVPHGVPWMRVGVLPWRIQISQRGSCILTLLPPWSIGAGLLVVPPISLPLANCFGVSLKVEAENAFFGFELAIALA
jgi:hypothetical protein